MLMFHNSCFLTVYLSTAGDLPGTAVYLWDAPSAQFVEKWKGRGADELYPLVISQASGPLVILAESGSGQVDSTQAFLFEMNLLGPGDYVSR